MANPPSIVCKECSHVNEAQRVYCHNCGVKLDRSAVAEKLQKGSESNAQKQRRVKKIMSPGGGLLGKGWGKTLVRTVFWGAVAGLAINLLRAPDDVPPMPGNQLPDAPPLGAYLQELRETQGTRVVAFKEDEINRYLQSTLRPKRGRNKEQTEWVRFQRAFVGLDPGEIRVTSQSALFDYPIYSGITLAAKGEKGNLTAKPVALHFGRITVPEFITQHLEKPAAVLFSSLSDALKQEQGDLKAVGALEIREDAVVIASPGTEIPSAPPVQTPPPAQPAQP